jgi:tetratricopeptide (TPR) repeat protein
MGRALDDAPSMDKAFEAIERVLGERQDWKGLVRAYTQMIKRLGDGATAAQQLYLWTRLADIASEKLGDRPAAMAAYEVAAALEPNNVGRHEQLADLYLAAGASHVDKAAAELQLLLRRAPDRLELYHKLYGLYASSGQRDKAYCLAQALALLGRRAPRRRRWRRRSSRARRCRRGAASPRSCGKRRSCTRARIG